MKKINILLAVILIGGVILSLGGVILVSQAQSKPMSRKIVVFKSGVDEQTKEVLIKKSGVEKIKDLRLVNGRVVLLTIEAEKSLARHKDILRIEDDVVVFIPPLENSVNSIRSFKRAAFIQPAQVLSWGIDRIDAEKVWATSTADTIKVAIIDTGIDRTHRDLIDNLKGGFSAVGYTTSFNDDNGHGTHVAGIVGAIDNTIGVIGVGPKIDLYAVKVLDRRGSGYLSDVIEGLDWAIANNMQVINMSLGTTVNTPSFWEAIQRVNSAGITQVAAAGNSGGSVNYPAAYLEVIAVSATDIYDNVPSWSSRGSEVDLSAPGVSIYSTYKGGKYKTLSGTSMAAPHVAGVAALVIDKKTCDYDLDGICSPAEVQQRLEATAEDLGATGRDNLYGFGLIDTEKAITP